MNSLMPRSWAERSIGPWSARAQIQALSPISRARMRVARKISDIGKVTYGSGTSRSPTMASDSRTGRPATGAVSSR